MKIHRRRPGRRTIFRSHRLLGREPRSTSSSRKETRNAVGTLTRAKDVSKGPLAQERAEIHLREAKVSSAKWARGPEKHLRPLRSQAARPPPVRYNQRRGRHWSQDGPHDFDDTIVRAGGCARLVLFEREGEELRQAKAEAQVPSAVDEGFQEKG